MIHSGQIIPVVITASVRHDVAVRQPIRWTIFLRGISLLPVLVQRIRNFSQPRPVFDLFLQFRRGKTLYAIRFRIAQWLEQARGHENRHIMRLAIEHPRRLLRRQPGW